MKLKIFSSFTFITLISLSCFANDEVVRPNNKLSGSSASARENQEFQINVQPVGIGPSLGSTVGLQLGTFLDPNSLFFLELTSGKNSSSSSLSDIGSNYSINSSSIGLHYKHFVANSFYWRGGLDYRKIKVDYTYNWIFNTSNDSRSFEGTSYAFNFSIGNQWQWDSFTMGCDWVGYSLPFASSINSESVQSTTPDYDRARLKEDQDKYVKNGNITLVRFYLGWSF